MEFVKLRGEQLIDLFILKLGNPKNIWQETPKQIRQKVLKFVNIPEQFAVYAKKSGLLDQIVKDSPIGGILEQEKIEID